MIRKKRGLTAEDIAEMMAGVRELERQIRATPVVLGLQNCLAVRHYTADEFRMTDSQLKGCVLPVDFYLEDT